jgi:hypothetical protein
MPNRYTDRILPADRRRRTTGRVHTTVVEVPRCAWAVDNETGQCRGAYGSTGEGGEMIVHPVTGERIPLCTKHARMWYEGAV